MTIYSHSRLSAYENCPLQYKLRYLEKPDIVKYQGIEAFVGTCFHETMEKLYGDLKFAKINTLEELYSYYEAIWDKSYSEDILIVKQDRTCDDYKQMGLKCISSYYNRYYPFDQSRTLGIETKIEIDLDGTGRYRVQGYIDRLSQDDKGVYEIHDYKTSGSIPSQKKLDNDRQLALYHEGLNQNWNDVKEVKLIWHYVVFDKTMTSARCEKELEKLKKDTISLINEIENAEEFLPCESSLCNWCDYVSVCPLKKHSVKVEALAVNEFLQEEGVDLVNTLDQIETEKRILKNKIKEIDLRADNVKAALINYAEKENIVSVVGRDKQVKISTKVKVDIPKKNSDQWYMLEKKLDAFGELKKFTTLDANAVKKAIKQNDFSEEQLYELKEFYIQEEQKQISLSKIKK